MDSELSVGPFKKQISCAINPPLGSDIDLRAGRNAITQFSKSAPDNKLAKLDLMIYYVEEAAAQTLEYGTIHERFYDSMCSMLDSILDLTNSMNPIEYSDHIDRLQKLDAQTSGRIGWGACDYITATFEELRSRREKIFMDSD